MNGVSSVFPHGRVHEALLRLAKAGLTDEDIQKIVESRDLAEQIVGLLHPIFLSEQKRLLEADGYEIVQVPGVLSSPVTLNKLYHAQGKFGVEFDTSWHGDFSEDDILFPRVQRLPLKAGEIAWKPVHPLIHGSVGLTFAEQERLVADHCRKVRERFGVKAVFPSAEHVLYVLSDHYWRTRTRKHSPGSGNLMRTSNLVRRTASEWGRRLVVWGRPFTVDEVYKYKLMVDSCDDDKPGAGIFELLVPESY